MTNTYVEPRVLDFTPKPEVAVYRRHNCARKHRSETTFIECALGKKVGWVTGVGKYASISWCNGRRHRSRYVTVVLCKTLDDAVRLKSAIDYMACGGGCHRRHQVVRIELGS